MSTLNSTKYKIPSRIVSGAVNVLPDDCILDCDTTDAPVILTLPNIPDDYWQTSYKIYINDYNSNASANNITIIAGTGQYINGLSSYVMVDSDSKAVITISSNNSFLLNYASDQPIGAIQVLNEGVSLTTAVTSINFTGDGVTASATGNAVTVNVPDIAGGLVAVVSLTSKTLPIASPSIRRIADGSVFNGTNSLSYDTVLEYGSFSSTFDSTTGIWTCPVTGYYDITTFLALIANASPNENSIVPNSFQPSATSQLGGLLVVGVTYIIQTYAAGDDFTNVGASSNATGVTFVATGTTPTTWTNFSSLKSPSYEIVSSTPYGINMNQYIGSFGICAEAAGTIYCQQHVPVYFDNSCINISGTYTNRMIVAGTQISCRFLNKTQLIGGGVSGSSFHFTIKRVY